MSSKTTNYNLHKIDLNDSPPDITVLNQNFDTIDEKLANALSVLPIQTNAPDDYMNLPLGTSHFVYTGLIGNDPFDSTGVKRVHAVKMQGTKTDSAYVYIVSSVDGGDMGKLFIGYETAGKIKWNGYLSLAGGELTGLDIWFNNGKTSKISDDNTGGILLYVQNTNDANNRRALRLKNKETVDKLQNMLVLEEKINGVNTEYRIYGEHNKDLLVQSILPLIGTVPATVEE